MKKKVFYIKMILFLFYDSYLDQKTINANLIVTGINSHNFVAIIPNMSSALAKALGVSKTVVDMTFEMSSAKNLELRINKKETTTQNNIAETAVIKAIVVGFNQEEDENYLESMAPQTFVRSMNKMIKEDPSLVKFNINVTKSGEPIVGLRHGKLIIDFFAGL
jgi:hypothetical protein